MWKVLTALVVLVLVVWEPGSWLVGLAGAVCGLPVALALLQVGLLLGALVWRVRVTLIVIGVGGEVRTWDRPHRRVVLRNVPLIMSVGLTSVRAPVRRRLWLTSLVSVLLTGAAVALCWVFAGGTPFGRGLAVAGSAVLLNGLVPRRGAGGTSPGWFLLRLPRLAGRVVDELEATPMVNEVSDALAAGEVDRAEEIAARLVAAHPTLLVAIGSQIAVLTMRTRYAEALHVVSKLVGRTDLDQRDMAFVMAEMASSTANAMEAGQLPLDVGMGAAKRASEGALQLGYPKYRCTGTLAQLALLEDDTALAIELAGQAKRSSESALARADALATLARAQMAAGDNAAARRTLVEAHALAGWMPRVAETSARLDIR
ncbi:tetratricopeptide repeat protein [Actinosynnema sp. CS-041913]|uniref:tetratricopeptide repeat protein n=1 Tax=Actinosynnema sp. CS-041913 TaxID=3239917 RepID=UPI003D8B3075